MNNRCKWRRQEEGGLTKLAPKHIRHFQSRALISLSFLSYGDLSVSIMQHFQLTHILVFSFFLREDSGMQTSWMNVFFNQGDQSECISFHWTTLVVFWPWLNLFWLGETQGQHTYSNSRDLKGSLNNFLCSWKKDIAQPSVFPGGVYYFFLSMGLRINSWMH